MLNKHIVLLKNDKDYQKFLFDLLTENNYKVTIAESDVKLLNDLHKLDADLIISSYMLPNIDAESFYKKICEDFPEFPIIFISQLKNESLITEMLKYPTCEFLVKPVVTAELLARIKVLLTPPKEDCEDGEEILIGDLKLNLKTKRVYRGKKEIILTPTEFKLLEYLMSHKDTVLSRDSILNKVWGTTTDVSDRIVDVYIGYLREKIDDNQKTKLLKTVTGFGYSITTV